MECSSSAQIFKALKGETWGHHAKEVPFFHLNQNFIILSLIRTKELLPQHHLLFMKVIKYIVNKSSSSTAMHACFVHWSLFITEWETPSSEY